jgi:hypothetical protein
MGAEALREKMNTRRNAWSTIANTIVAGWAVSAALWIAPAVATDASAIRPGDEAMTCEQIATELYPYAQQMAPNIQALGASQQQLYAQGRQIGQKRMAEEALLAPLATAGSVDPTGASKWAYQAALAAQMAKRPLPTRPSPSKTGPRASSSRRRASSCNPTRVCSA